MWPNTLLLAAFFVASVHCTSGSVVPVTNETFRSVIDGSDYVLLEVCVLRLLPTHAYPTARHSPSPPPSPPTPQLCALVRRVQARGPRV